MTYDPQWHHRRSIRLPGYDYSQEGVIFVTACTYQRENLFGEVVAGQMVTNDIGRIVLAAWQGLPLRFPSLILDEFVVMPNHIHGILIFAGGESGAGADAPAGTTVGAEKKEGVVALQEGAASGAPTLAQVMRVFKSLVAVSGNRLLGRTERPLWQRNFYEHIIRTEQVLEKAQWYTAENPRRWERDKDNLVNL